MKYRVYLHGFWQLEFVIHRPNFLVDFEWSQLLVIQLVARSFRLDIFSK